jgi:hypothetical protein
LCVYLLYSQRYAYCKDNQPFKKCVSGIFSNFRNDYSCGFCLRKYLSTKQLSKSNVKNYISLDVFVLPLNVACFKLSLNKLEIFKNYNTNSIRQARLTGLAFLSMENKKQQKLRCKNLPATFQTQRPGKRISKS